MKQEIFGTKNSLGIIMKQRCQNSKAHYNSQNIQKVTNLRILVDSRSFSKEWVRDDIFEVKEILEIGTQSAHSTDICY